MKYLHFEHLLSSILPSSGGLPEVSSHEDGHLHLLSTDIGKVVVDDFFDSILDLFGLGKDHVDSTSGLTDHAKESRNERKRSKRKRKNVEKQFKIDKYPDLVMAFTLLERSFWDSA